MSEPVPFPTPEHWWDWLASHPDAREVWVLYHRKGTGTPSIDWDDAVLGAIAHGWIDGVRKTVNEAQWTQRFTPRKPASAWSARNIAHAERLIAEGRMAAAGLAAVEAGKASGRWEAGYSGGKGAEVPADFLEALALASELARQTYAAQKAQGRFAIYYRLHTAKTPETRAKRMENLLAKLARGENP